MSDLKVLIERLNPICRRGLELAAGLCVQQTNYNVEVEHLLAKLVDLPAIDLPPILGAYDVDVDELTHQLQQAIDTFDRGNRRTPALSPQVLRLLREAWVRTSLVLEADLVRSGALLLALVEDRELRGGVLQSCPILAHIPPDSLAHNLPQLVRGSAEERTSGRAPAAEPAAGKVSARRSAPPASRSRAPARSRPVGRAEGDRKAPGSPPESALDRYTVDLVARAAAGAIDPIRARQAELRQVGDVLSRRRQNNPILVGEAGVGKTAIAEGFALKIAAGEVPGPLRDASFRALDLVLLQAGAGVRGEFEARLESVISEVKGSSRPVILFIDEAHRLVGAGGSAGQGDAAAILKPALARGELRTLAATTWSEYKQYFESDPALARRFQPVRVEEPDEEAAVEMLRGVAPKLEEHHGVKILDRAVCDAVRLSQRYLAERRLPAKAITLLDTAAARVALGEAATPPAIEDLSRRIEHLEVEQEILRRERRARSDDGSGSAELAAEAERLTAERDALDRRWRQERERVAEIRRLEGEWAAARSNGHAESPEATALAEELARLEEECRVSQGEEPMVPLAVDSRVVAGVVAGWTGIPVGRVLSDEVAGILSLEERLAERIVGQAEALAAISRQIRTSRAGLEDPGKPKGVFLLAGPSGVGKTETAAALAELLYGGERNLVTVHMSEFQEAHSVATLKGAPPGYVGYGRGGVLTEAVRRKPYSVVLLDEIEKAHEDVVELFYQVFDKGTLEDGEGIPVDFRNTVILLTTNLGEEVVRRASDGADRLPADRLAERLRPTLLERFRTSFLGRLEVVPYYPLGAREMREIVALKLADVQARVRANHLAELTFDAALVDVIARRCTESESGARTIDQILNRSFLPELASRILERRAEGKGFSRVRITVDEFGRFL